MSLAGGPGIGNRSDRFSLMRRTNGKWKRFVVSEMIAKAPLRRNRKRASLSRLNDKRQELEKLLAKFGRSHPHHNYLCTGTGLPAQAESEFEQLAKG